MQTGNTLSRKFTKIFSNDRLLIADFETAEEFLRELCDELLNQKNKFIKKSIGIVFQPVDSNIKTITPVERRIYYDSAHYSGAKYIWIVDHQNILSDNEVFEITTKKTNHII